jgi:hypothetical protein
LRCTRIEVLLPKPPFGMVSRLGKNRS